MRTRTFALAAVIALAASTLPFAAQEKIDPDINAKIRQEETAHSRIMRTLHFLTDVHGPRLTGSPAHKAAAEWAIRFYCRRGFRQVSPEQKARLLNTYWTVPDRQIETSVVLANPPLDER